MTPRPWAGPGQSAKNFQRVMEGDTLRADVTSHRSADVNTFTRS